MNVFKFIKDFIATIAIDSMLRCFKVNLKFKKLAIIIKGKFIKAVVLM